jgi:adenylosuccinate synthase
MPATVICGLHWGDEGKGKATDLLAADVSAVVRYQGGDNAGHTVVVGEEVFKLHLVPSGVLHDHITPIVGPGVVVNPRTLLTEIEMLGQRGIATAKLRVSNAAHVIMPYHVALDAAREGAAAEDGVAIGTTRRGIGPAYGDRAWRSGIRMGDLLEPELLRSRLTAAVTEKNALLTSYGADTFALDDLLAQALDWGRQLAWAITDTTALVQDALGRGEHVLFEGAQGTMLDLDHGTYPYVTSSNPIAGGACTGGGIGPLQVDQVLGILKAYSTRVGAGPLPTELKDAVGEHLTEKGHEYGTTTGRRRRSGWLDFVPLRYAVQVNSVNTLMLNKIDILSGLPELKVCVGYRVDGRLVAEWPLNVAQLERAEPVYETLEGWSEDLSGCRSVEQLPAAARRYVAAIEERAGAPIDVISVGPERNQTLMAGAGRVLGARRRAGAAA